jgi:hypothetical protein
VVECSHTDGDSFSLAICHFPLTSDRVQRHGREGPSVAASGQHKIATSRAETYIPFSLILVLTGLYANLMTLTPFITLLFLIYILCHHVHFYLHSSRRMVLNLISDVEMHHPFYSTNTEGTRKCAHEQNIAHRVSFRMSLL